MPQRPALRETIGRPHKTDPLPRIACIPASARYLSPRMAPGMNAHPIDFYPNLPERQQFTQHLADQFNADERLWASLEPQRRRRRLACSRLSCRCRNALDLAEFARAQPPKDCVAWWSVA